jgi:hypothetical protein
MAVGFFKYKKTMKKNLKKIANINVLLFPRVETSPDATQTALVEPP